MADWYFAFAIGANPSDPTKHPVNGNDSNTGTSPASPVTFEYALNTLRSSGDTLWAYPSTVPNIRPIPAINLYTSIYCFVGNWPSGTTYIRSLASPHYMTDPFGDGQTYERATDRHIIIAGINILNGNGTVLDAEDVMFQLEGAIDAPPDTVAGETWATKLGANYNSIPLQYRHLLGSANSTNSHVFRMKRCAYRIGQGPTWAPVDVNTKYPDFNSTDWGDSAPNIYENNWYFAPAGIGTTRGAEITLNDCRFEDINSGIQVNVVGTANVLLKNCWFRRIYQDATSIGDGDETVAGAAFDVEFNGCLFQDCFGHLKDKNGPHCDGGQVYWFYSSNAAGSNDNPVLAPGPRMKNCMFIITGRSTSTGEYVQGAHDGGLLYAVSVNPQTRGCIFIGCRDAIQVASASATSKAASWWSDMRRNIVVMPTDQLTSATNNENYTIATPLTSATRGITAQYCTDNIFEASKISVQTTKRNNTNAGFRGVTLGYSNIFQGDITIAANGNVPQNWWNAVQRKPAYASQGPQGYTSLKQWLEDNNETAGTPYPTECAFVQADGIATSAVATSGASLIMTHAPGDVVPFVPAAGIEWLELAAYDRVTRGGVPNQFTVTGSTGTFTQTAHGFTNGTLVRVVSRSSAMTGINTTTNYYVVNATTNTLQLSATSGGSAITAVHASTLTALVVRSSQITQDWSSSSGTVTGYRFMVKKGTAAVTPATQTRYTSTIDGLPTTWSIITASNNAFPSCTFPTLHRFQRTNTGSSGIADSNYFCFGFRGIIGGAGVAKGLSGFLTGSAGPWQIFFTNTNTLRVRLRNMTGATGGSGQICDIDFGTVDRTGTVLTEIFLVVDVTQPDKDSGVFAYKRSGGTGAVARVTSSGAWGASGPIAFSYTAQPTQVFGLNDFTTLASMEAFFITNELIDVTDDPTNPAIFAKFTADWVGEFFEGFTDNRPPIAFVGLAADLNQTNPLNRGYVTGWTQFSTGGTPNSCVAIASQTWPVPLTYTSEVVSAAPYTNMNAVDFLVKPIGYANANTITPSVNGTPGTPVAALKGSAGTVISLNLSGPSHKVIAFAQNSIHINPSNLNLDVAARYPGTVIKTDTLTPHPFNLDVYPA